MRYYKRFVLAAALVAAALTMTVTALQQEQAALAEKLIRLHVVANSDSEMDQQLKLQVRDAVLNKAEQAVQRAEDPAAALQAALPLLKETAEACLRQCGSAQTAEVSLKHERFPTRAYETFSLPAGVYPSLRIVLGEGKGHNWWCVVFPSVCLRAVSQVEAAAVSAGFSEGEIYMITHPEEYVFKFKILELLQQLQNWLT